MIIGGVDEAGRGCVIGPLVVAGVTVKTEDVPALIELGVKDSKLLTPKKREALYPKILQICQSHHVIKVPPSLIDKAVLNTRRLHKLNRLEAQTMAQVIEALKPDHVFVDAADVVETRFKIHIHQYLTIKTQITSKHKADRTYPVVSAASIIAKVERDREIENLKIEYGDCGTGYLTDDRTICFLKFLLAKNGDYPDFVRRSWKPAIKIKADHQTKQTTLS
jgi:ribonuclease HII